MIPKIIHQIWTTADDKPMPAVVVELCDTWKENHPECEYILWDRNLLHQFIKKYYYKYVYLLESYHYDIQRIDALKYFVLHHYGGVYVDVDSENIRNIFELLGEHDCYLSREQDNLTSVLGNSFIACQPQSQFVTWLLDRLEDAASNIPPELDKLNSVLRSTGPIFLTEAYTAFNAKEKVFLLSSCHLSPLSASESREMMRTGVMTEIIEDKMARSYAVHYYFTTWL